MWWLCDECCLEYEADPTGHTDYGGVIVVYGPSCPECGATSPSCLGEEEST